MRRFLTCLIFFFFFIKCIQAQIDLFGLTQSGGSDDKGTAYQIKSDGTGFQKFGDFIGGNGARPGSNSSFTQLQDGLLVGMSELGGSFNSGAFFVSQPGQVGLSNIFFFNPSLFEFNGTDRGGKPLGPLLLASDGNLYGTTSSGGGLDRGTVFRVTAYGGGFFKIVDFGNEFKGKNPNGGLIQASNGYLYGMTESGGVNNSGVVFKLDMNGFIYKKLFDFDYTNTGSTPKGSLIEAGDGLLYGATQFGGKNGKGAIFRIDLDGGNFEKIFDFEGTNSGRSPNGSLIESIDGYLYGMTLLGGLDDLGTIFKIKKDGSGFQKIFDFNATSGWLPYGSLLLSKNNDMYGVTWSGGLNNKGTLFKLQGGHTHIKLFDFTSSTGSFPVGNLILKRLNQTLSFNPLNEKRVGDPPLILVASASSGLPINFFSSNPNVAIVNENEIMFVGPGTAKITAMQRGNEEYMPVSINNTLVVKLSQTISFEKLTDKEINSPSFKLKATSSSALPVQFSTSSNKITIDVDKVKIIQPGRASIQADQSGDQTFGAAQPVIQSFCINPAKPIITVTDLNTDSPNLASSNLVGNQWYLNGVAITGATSSTFAAKESGAYSVKTTVDNCSSELSVEQILVVTGDIENESSEKIRLYPNPAKTEIVVGLENFERGSSVEVEIFDLSGRKVEKKSGVGGRKLPIDIKHYSPGKYILKAGQGERKYSKRFIKE